jgi:hypothetical protein
MILRYERGRKEMTGHEQNVNIARASRVAGWTAQKLTRTTVLATKCRKPWVFAVYGRNRYKNPVRMSGLWVKNAENGLLCQESSQNGAILAFEGHERTNPNNNSNKMWVFQRFGASIGSIWTGIRTFCPYRAEVIQKSSV